MELTYPREDIAEARRRGYSVVRVMITASMDGKTINQRTQVRTGFQIDPPMEIWEDLYQELEPASEKGQ